MCPQASEEVEPDKKLLNCQSGSDVFAPVLLLLISEGHGSVRCIFLDTGAQFSNINKQLIERKVG